MSAGSRDLIRLHIHQTLQDAAMLQATGLPAAMAQFNQLFLQVFQFRNAHGYMLDVLIQQIIHRGAVLRRAVHKCQQAADFFVCHIQAAAVANKT